MYVTRSKKYVTLHLIGQFYYKQRYCTITCLVFKTTPDSFRAGLRGKGQGDREGMVWVRFKTTITNKKQNRKTN